MFKAGSIGPEVTGWTPPPMPVPEVMQGQQVELAPLSPDHGPALWRAIAGQPDLWLYMAAGPFADEQKFLAWITAQSSLADPQFYAIRKQGGDWIGMASYMRITPKDGTIEVGSILYGPELQGSPAATEAMLLMAERAFTLGYRRYEWKCNAHNRSSRRAAQRLGFSYEGIFRQHMVVKGRSRDTAWFSILDQEWPALRTAYRAWLATENFDDQGRQRRSLSAMTAPLLQTRDPELAA